MPTANYEDIYRFFKTQSGSYAIAKPHNIEAIIHFCRQKQPKRVLELGGGIGTLSYTILSVSDATIDIYENNDFCQNKLNENLKAWPGRFQIIEDYKTLPPAKEYDVVIIDGPDPPGLPAHRVVLTENIIGSLDRIGTVFVEGLRHNQRRAAQRCLAKKSGYRLQKIPGRDMPGDTLSKGGLFIHSKTLENPILRNINYWFWTLTDLIDLRDPYRRSEIAQKISGKINKFIRIFRND